MEAIKRDPNYMLKSVEEESGEMIKVVGEVLDDHRATVVESATEEAKKEKKTKKSAKKVKKTKSAEAETSSTRAKKEDRDFVEMEVLNKNIAAPNSDVSSMRQAQESNTIAIRCSAETPADLKILEDELIEKKKELETQIGNYYEAEDNLRELEASVPLLVRRSVCKANEEPSDLSQGIFVSSNLGVDSRKFLSGYQRMLYLLYSQPQCLARIFLQNSDNLTAVLTIARALFGNPGEQREDVALAQQDEYVLLSLISKIAHKELSSIARASDFVSKYNTVLTKGLFAAFYQDDLLEAYLEGAVWGVLRKWFMDPELNLETNPSIVSRSLLSANPHRASFSQQLSAPVSDKEVKAIITKRIALLEEICQEIVDTICATVDRLPYGFRWICRIISDTLMLETKGPEAMLSAFSCIYFQEFISDALLDAPNLNETFRTETNLIAIGMVITRLFSLKEFGDKEHHLMPLNKFLQKNKERLLRFYNDLIAVPYPEEHLSFNQYLPLAPKVINIKPEDLYWLHTNLWHLEELESFLASDYFNKIVKELGPPHVQVIKNHDFVDSEVTIRMTNPLPLFTKTSKLNRLRTSEVGAPTKQLELRRIKLSIEHYQTNYENLRKSISELETFLKEATKNIYSNSTRSIRVSLKDLIKSGVISRSTLPSKTQFNVKPSTQEPGLYEFTCKPDKSTSTPLTFQWRLFASDTAQAQFEQISFNPSNTVKFINKYYRNKL